MSNVPDESVEKAPRAARKVREQRLPCEQSERVGGRSPARRAHGVNSEQDKFVTEWSCNPDDEAAENLVRSRDQRSQ
jgi:hypothetical protein